nr:hypothetical protein [Mesorhizobium sp.]
MIEERTAHIDRVWFGCRLYARREVDAVPDQIIALHHDIRDMETEPHPERFGVGLLCACKRAADLECTAHGVYGARKFGEGPVARRLENPAVEQIDLFRNEGLTASQAFRGLLLGSILRFIAKLRGGRSPNGSAIVLGVSGQELSALRSRPHRESALQTSRRGCRNV